MPESHKILPMQIAFEGVHGNDEVYMDCLRAICGDTEGKSMADLCCNLAPHTPKLGYKNRVYVDILPRTLDYQNEQQYFVQADVIEYLDMVTHRPIYPFDVTICSDGIEHFHKKDGEKLLDLMYFAAPKVVIFTPLGEYLVDDTDNPEGHHSGWLPKDLEGKGFASIVLPNYHPTLGIGAFFSWYFVDWDGGGGMQNDFERVKNELKQKTWAKN